jgi:hypothetical protein
MKRIRPASEAEVISEFLKNEFHQKEYHADRVLNERLVMNPDLTDDSANRLRRELLYRRHRFTWKELPKDVRWSQVDLDLDDVSRIRVFPRGHWPKMTSDSNFSVGEIARNIRQRAFNPEVADDVSAIHAIAYRLREQPDTTAVLLIGVDEEKPLTILEGNHRMIAATLVSPERVTCFKTYVGLSPLMTDCFWYDVALDNMLRYAWRRVLNFQPDILRDLKQRWAE